MALKDNPSHLHQDVAALFDRLHASSGTRQDWLGGAVGRAYTTCTEHDSGHGRQERRACRVLTLAAEDPDWADVEQEWAGLRSLVPLTRTRTQNGTTSVETVYYLARLPQDARRLEQALRRHWQIENCLHHVLDVGMNAHACRIRRDQAPVTMALLRSIALNLIRKDTSRQTGVKAKQKLAGWDNNFLLQLLLA